MGEERQHSRVVRPAGSVRAHFPDDQFRKTRFELQPHRFGRAGHRVAQLGGGQRPEHHVPVLQRVGQFGVPEAVLVEVGAYAQDHERGSWVTGVTGVTGVAGGARRLKDLDEGAPARLVGAEGERLLELIHDDDRPGVAGRLAPGPGRDGFPHRVRESRSTTALGSGFLR